MGAKILPLTTARSRPATPATVISLVSRLVVRSLSKRDDPPSDFTELLDDALEAAYEAKQAASRLEREGSSDQVPEFRFALLSSLIQLSIAALLTLGHFPDLDEVDPDAWSDHLREIGKVANRS